ncbi:hypothetical protein XENOCAPTIV_003309, partial [Xenoophorus captivus]
HRRNNGIAFSGVTPQFKIASSWRSSDVSGRCSSEEPVSLGERSAEQQWVKQRPLFKVQPVAASSPGAALNCTLLVCGRERVNGLYERADECVAAAFTVKPTSNHKEPFQ